MAPLGENTEEMSNYDWRNRSVVFEHHNYLASTVQVCWGCVRLRKPGRKSQCLLSLFIFITHHKRSYNVKTHWKYQGRNFTHEKASNRLSYHFQLSKAAGMLHAICYMVTHPMKSKSSTVLWTVTVNKHILRMWSNVNYKTQNIWKCVTSICVEW